MTTSGSTAPRFGGGYESRCWWFSGPSRDVGPLLRLRLLTEPSPYTWPDWRSSSRWALLERLSSERSRSCSVVHALSGGAALISGPLQFNGRLRRWRRNAHRVIGRVYVGAILISSVTALLLTTTFDVSLATKIALGTIAVLWPATTVIALLRILDGDVTRHREWMVRSFSLTLFFVTFSIWVPGLEATALPDSISYPLGVFLSWSLNLLVAELWIRRTKVEWARPLIPKQKRELGRRHAGARQVMAAQTADLLIPDFS